MKKTYILIIAIIFGLQSGFAQNIQPATAGESTDPTANEQVLINKLQNRHLPGFFGLGFENSVPQGEYMNNIGEAGPGFTLYGGYRVPVVPVTFGMQVDFHFYKSQTKYPSYYWGGLPFKFHDTVNTSNSAIPISIFARVEPNLFNFVFPYVEGFVGYNIMTASYSRNYDFHWEAEEENEDETDGSFYYGIGLGTQIKLTDFITLPNSISRMLLDVKFRYLMTGENDYYTVQLDENTQQPIFTKTNSNNNQVLFTIGIVWHFGGQDY